tara:strand:+ start:17 stop:373 length:357 start_codon:yes stop_codon:yes gene_type:complete
MNNSSKPIINKVKEAIPVEANEVTNDLPNKGPINYLFGSMTGITLSFLGYRVSKSVVIYFSLHSLVYKSPMAQSISSGLKTLIEGMCFLATFSFGFIGLGLFLVFIKSLFDGNSTETD